MKEAHSEYSQLSGRFLADRKRSVRSAASMVPAAFGMLQKLPRTLNGKVDRASPSASSGLSNGLPREEVF